ncbi:hypothetical protein PAECIP111891_07103 [Paenibacillus allorhizoplanae]|uniref:Uncharacterized protein n=1 Tax=Paenibacillus allorhizoplanae TaxID=2905648 RepID=A0ABN8H6N8_9BACL|nr:hypothetical protein [Paenibacillus allorhizoplanae]CAH1232840.1 hypothetical protein PAECIP111891_07103 [Paenibacillus allorhizoplanae]
MGLDVLMYDDCNRLVSLYEINEELHKVIFSSHKRWESYSYLKKLKNYYRTNEEFSGELLEGLICDLNCYKPLMAAEYHTTLQLFLEAISDNKVKRIRISGD